MSFEWRTDEDEGWQEGPKPEKTAVSQSFLRRRWRFLLVGLLGIAAVWGVVQWQISQRITAATAVVESELLNTHNFLLRTAANQDEDLFNGNLSGRDPAWSEMQKTLLNEGLLLDRPMLGWQHEVTRDALALEDVAITVAPTLDAAELLYPQSYAVQTPTGVTETVTLQQTAVYRLGERRWLYSPPYPEFWGDWITQGGEHVTLAYTERDREVAARLAQDLDQLIGQMCSELEDINCNSEMRVHLRLGTDAESLLEISDIETMLRAGLRLELPTPTLVGLPVDEAGYEVLYQAYGVQLATAVLAHQVAYNCCRHELFFRALRDYQLAELGLQPWPLTEEMYSQMLTAGFDGHVTRHWTRRWEEAPPQFLQVWMIEDPEPIWQQVYMLIDFLAAQETAVSPAEMMRLMERNSYDDWLASVLSSDAPSPVVETRFLEYIYAQTRDGQQAESPIPLPEGKITLVCEDYSNNGPQSRVFVYDLATHTWAERFADQFTNAFVVSTDGDSFVFSEHAYVEPNNISTFYLATQEGTELIEEVSVTAQTEHWISYFLVDQASNYLMRYENDEGQVDRRLREVGCASAGCAEIQVEGWPLFSPDKRHILLPVVDEQGTDPGLPLGLQSELYLVSLEEKQPVLIDQGGNPFWMTEAAFGYVKLSVEGWEIVTATLDRSEPKFLLDEAQLLVHFSADERPISLWFNQVVANPKNPQELVLMTFVGEWGEGYDSGAPVYLFKVLLNDDLTAVTQIELLPHNSTGDTIRFSPDGRFIIVGDYGFSDPSVTWLLLDNETGHEAATIVTQGYNFTWSPDGQWFVQDANNYLLLTAPTHDYKHFIPHGFGRCPQVLLSAGE